MTFHRTSALLVIGLIVFMGSCNPGGTGYYIFKGIWNKKLKREARIGIYMETLAINNFSGFDSAPEYLLESEESYTAQFEGDIRDKLSEVRHAVPTEANPEFKLTITGLALNEKHNIETCEGEDFNMVEVEVEVDYILTLAGSEERIEEGRASVSERDDLKTKTPEGQPAYCVKRMRSLSFSNLLNRAADKAVAKVTNDIVKYRKKG